MHAPGAVTPITLSQDDMVGFRVNLPILGDITLGLWFGDHKSELDPPAFAYAANTAFLQVCSSRQQMRQCGLSSSVLLTIPQPQSVSYQA